MNWAFLFDISCWILWCAAYVFMIAKAIKDKKVAMPVWALAMNFTWECFYAALAFRDTSLAFYIRASWLLLDCVLLFLLLRYNRRYFPERLQAYFYPLVAIALSTCLGVQFAFYFGIEN